MSWKEEDEALVRKFEFKDFKSAFAFMQEVADLCEQHDHHPHWVNVYNKVEIRLTTHDAGNQVTEKDRQLAAAIDHLMINH